MKETILSNVPGDHPWRSHIHWFDTIDSTNTRAKQMALSGAPHGTVLLAGHQTDGRGRMGRSFHSPAESGVYFSVILRPQCTPDRLMHLTCAAAVAACNAVEQAAGFRPGIKWTNDLVCGNRKIAGILTELITVGNETCAIVGIGINCSQQESDFSEDIRSFAGSLTMAAGKPIDRCTVAVELIRALKRMDDVLLTEKEALMARYRADCITVGRFVSLLRADTVRYGQALCVDDDGALVVRFADGSTEAVQSGEVSVRGMYGYIS
jgi:BirA family biotin operon repressor/biotin-[acetyl-CoA-carboxylase] ligase